MAGQDVPVLVGKYRGVKSESVDTFGKGSNLSPAVLAGISRMRLEIGNSPKRDLRGTSEPSLLIIVVTGVHAVALHTSDAKLRKLSVLNRGLNFGLLGRKIGP
jgi:hypothetical protein